MSSILLDGQSVAEAAYAMGYDRDYGSRSGPGHCLRHGYEHVSLENDGWICAPVTYDALVNIIYSIVLWDHIYVLKEAFNSRWLETVTFFQDHDVPFKTIDSPEYMEAKYNHDQIARFFYGLSHGHVNYADNLLTFMPKDKDEREFLTENNEDEFFISRIRNYINLSNLLGMDYLPSVRRQIALERMGIKSSKLRIEAMRKMDTTLQDYYMRLNNVIGDEVYKFSLPVLIDYLMQRYSTAKDIINAALELKNERNVILFRKQFDELEEAFKAGDSLEIGKYFKRIEEIVANIARSFETEQKISFEICLLPTSITIPLKLELERFNPKAYQLLFIKDLATYGVRGRQMVYVSNV